ncbi:unnamed protein product [Thelazia callipaeda]|uniref:DUF2052 domain-containing protein n=1 Tax=Thelazia callipaeda TaxID=103827 RepID=A0A0N5D9R1_THECL|nr:unnamed protein product [Thelazia callipaeda]
MGVTEKFKKLSISPSVNGMISRIVAENDVFYRLEQRNTPDLTLEEKRDFLADLYVSDPRLFLRRYHEYLSPEDCDCFDDDDYENKFYMKKIIQKSEIVDIKKHDETKFRNKRYAELLRLKKETDYFTDKKMREREPLLFDKMIGRFLPEEEQFYLRPTIENESLSGVFMQFEDSQIISNRRAAQLSEWNEFLKVTTVIIAVLFEVVYKKCKFIGSTNGDNNCEKPKLGKLGSIAHHASNRLFEIESNEADEMKPETCFSASDDCQPSSSRSEDQESASESSEDGRDQEQLRADFIDHMEQRFLSGEDKEFYDYSRIDSCTTKEYEKMHDQDLEDAYFEND